MKNTMTDTKDVILSLKRVKQERCLSIDAIYELVEANDPSKTVSRTSVARVFREGSEDQIFKWENTLKPIANALLDIDEIEADDDIDTQAYKSILKLKKDIISELEERLETTETKVGDVEHYKKAITHLESQLALKDKRIDQLLDANDELRKDITALTKQLLTCPCRNSGQIGGEE